jgi:hypothetical protein
LMAKVKLCDVKMVTSIALQSVSPQFTLEYKSIYN